MASSSYYQSEMNRLSQQISSKKKRRNTCKTVKQNLENSGFFSAINNYVNSSADCLESGVSDVPGIATLENDLRQDREYMPDNDTHISAAILSLAQEISKLDREIDNLQQQYDTARSNYRIAKNREWQELMQKLSEAF